LEGKESLGWTKIFFNFLMRLIEGGEDEGERGKNGADWDRT